MTSDYQPPPWVSEPKLDNCGIRVVKQGRTIEIIKQIRAKAFTIFGRNASMCDYKLEHPSISRRHSLIAHGSSGNIYLMDLNSSHGTYLNSEKLTKHKRRPLKNNDVIKFGASTREYILKLDMDIDDISKFNEKIAAAAAAAAAATHGQQSEQTQNDSNHNHNHNEIENKANNVHITGTAHAHAHAHKEEPPSELNEVIINRKRPTSELNNDENPNSPKKAGFNASPKRLKSNDGSVAVAHMVVDGHGSDGTRSENGNAEKPLKISCRHILIKHKDSRRPKSWKSPAGIARSKEQALQILSTLRAELMAIAANDALRLQRFSEIASLESDCMSAKRGGDLGPFGRKRMQKPFEDAAFNLHIGEISGLVATQSGVHIILRVA